MGLMYEEFCKLISVLAVLKILKCLLIIFAGLSYDFPTPPPIN